jgi:hypothetical protein
MDIMGVFQMNWLDFTAWTLAICMGIALVVYLVEHMMPSRLLEKSKEISKWPIERRKAS